MRWDLNHSSICVEFILHFFNFFGPIFLPAKTKTLSFLANGKTGSCWNWNKRLLSIPVMKSLFAMIVSSVSRFHFCFLHMPCIILYRNRNFPEELTLGRAFGVGEVWKDTLTQSYFRVNFLAQSLVRVNYLGAVNRCTDNVFTANQATYGLSGTSKRQ